MKRKDYENVIEMEVRNAGTVADFTRGMEMGAIIMLKYIISIDEDLDEKDRSHLLEMAEKAKEEITSISWRKAVMKVAGGEEV